MVTTGLCQCGCGLPAPLARDTDRRRGNIKGQPQRYILGHQTRTRRRPGQYRRVGVNQREHVLVAERALGKPLPAGAQVHHVDGDKSNNAPSNLVICQDAAYHQLLHARARIIQAGGNPNTDRICAICKRVLPHDAFGRWSRDKRLGRQFGCRSCLNKPHQRRVA